MKQLQGCCNSSCIGVPLLPTLLLHSQTHLPWLPGQVDQEAQEQEAQDQEVLVHPHALQ